MLKYDTVNKIFQDLDFLNQEKLLDDLESYREKLILVLQGLYFSGKCNEILCKNLIFYYLQPYEITPEILIFIDNIYKVIQSVLSDIKIEQYKNNEELEKIIKEKLMNSLDFALEIFSENKYNTQLVNKALENLKVDDYITNFFYLEELRCKILSIIKILKNIKLSRNFAVLPDNKRIILEDTLIFLSYILSNHSPKRKKPIVLIYDEYINAILNKLEALNFLDQNSSLSGSEVEEIINFLEGLNKKHSLEEITSLLRKKWKNFNLVLNYFYLVSKYSILYLPKIETPKKAKLSSLSNLFITILSGGGIYLIISLMFSSVGFLKPIKEFFENFSLWGYPFTTILGWLYIVIVIIASISNAIDGYKEGFKLLKMACIKKGNSKIDVATLSKKDLEEEPKFVKKLCNNWYLLIPLKNGFILKTLKIKEAFISFSKIPLILNSVKNKRIN